jgi:hypothetical protein
MKLLYTEHSLWEFDFIKNDLLSTLQLDIEIVNRTQFKQLVKRSDIIKNTILVLNDQFEFNDIIAVVKYIQPIVIFYLSDEVGNQSRITELDQFCKIVFRQYNHRQYTYSKKSYQLPLGYPNTYINGRHSLAIPCKRIKDREIHCSFIGSMKSDRNHMATLVKQHIQNTHIVFVNNNWNINELPYSPDKCFAIYNNSIFVINGRGNCSLDCFRIYEAIVAGAIPVLVGSYDEIITTFNYNNDIPPLIYDDNWEKVVSKCKDLLTDQDTLQKLQDDLLMWWKRQLVTIHSKIIEASS